MKVKTRNGEWPLADYIAVRLQRGDEFNEKPGIEDRLGRIEATIGKLIDTLANQEVISKDDVEKIIPFSLYGEIIESDSLTEGM